MEAPKKPGDSGKRKKKGQDTLDVATAIVPGDTTLRGVYAYGYLHARRSRWSRQDSHDFASALMLLAASRQAETPGCLATEKEIDDFAFGTLVQVRRNGWKRDKRRTEKEGWIAFFMDTNRSEVGAEDRLLDKIDAQRLSAEMLRALASLLAREREVLVLSKLRGLETWEISEQLGIVEGRVHGYLCTAKKKMRDALAASFKNGGKNQ